jgi:hypothetical protein
MRWKKVYFAIVLAGVLIPLGVFAQDDETAALLSVELDEPSTDAPKVTAVYGISADDYLPMKESARKHLRPKVRSGTSHPSLDLPDAFYFIGAPVFVYVLLRVIVIFLTGFEEKRRQELRTVAQDAWDAE